MITTLAIIGVLLLVLAAGKINASIHFKKEVKHLFVQSPKISGKRFSYSQLTGLPQPVQRYFKHVLKEGQPYISYARLTHGGQFKTGLGKSWVNIQGEQYFTSKNPGFVWKGTTNMFTAVDRFVAGSGSLVVSLFSLIKVVNGKGATFNQGELLRWVAENVWFPTNLLPNDNLQWLPINQTSAKLTFTNNGLSVYFIVSFNEAGEITKMETKRFMGDGKLQNWLVMLNDYKEMHGILVPTNNEVAWILEKGNFSYAKFSVQTLEYDTPKIFRR